MNNETSTINWTRVNNDVNGNPRYVCHFFNLLNESESNNYDVDTSQKYEWALNRGKAIGGKKFHNKQYGGGIVFQSYNLKETENQIKELLNK